MVPQTTQTRISSYRVGLSPKPHTFVQKAQLDGAHKGEEGVDTTTEPNSRVSKVSLTSGLHQYPSTKVAAWTNQITEEVHLEMIPRYILVSHPCNKYLFWFSTFHHHDCEYNAETETQSMHTLLIRQQIQSSKYYNLLKPSKSSGLDCTEKHFNPLET